MSNNKSELIVKLSTEFNYDIKELISKDYDELRLMYYAAQILLSNSNDDLIDIL